MDALGHTLMPLQFFAFFPGDKMYLDHRPAFLKWLPKQVSACCTEQPERIDHFSIPCKKHAGTRDRNREVWLFGSCESFFLFELKFWAKKTSQWARRSFLITFLDCVSLALASVKCRLCLFAVSKKRPAVHRPIAVLKTYTLYEFQMNSVFHPFVVDESSIGLITSD